jgi:hypothetical protein
MFLSCCEYLHPVDGLSSWLWKKKKGNQSLGSFRFQAKSATINHDFFAVFFSLSRTTVEVIFW